ncbi:MAG: FecR family protein, partial [Opitutales bacterium]
QVPLLEGLRDVSEETRTVNTTARPNPWLRWPALAGATLTAAAAVALVLWLVHPARQIEDLTTPMARRQAWTLADGTRVELNAQTSLHVGLDGRERHVRLAGGEAFFAVSKDAARPFIVETPAGSVRVTGTRFDVRADSATSLEVLVDEGSVQVRPGAGPADAPRFLQAGDDLTAGPGGVAVRSLSGPELADALAWRQGQIVFDGVPLREALARFGRYHGRGFTVTAAAAELRVGGRYSLDDVDGFCAALEEVLPVRVTRDLSGTTQFSLRSER